MERAQAHKVGAPFFKLDVPSHDVHHISASDELLDKSLWDRHGEIVEVRGVGRVAQSPSTTPSRRGSAPPNQPFGVRAIACNPLGMGI